MVPILRRGQTRRLEIIGPGWVLIYIQCCRRLELVLQDTNFENEYY
jgi:hypothetical protein